MSTDAPGRPPSAARSPGGGRYWRSLAALLVFQALCWALVAAFAWLAADTGLAKDYLSAHHTVKETRRLLLPAVAAAAGAGFVLVGAGTALSLWRHTHRLLRPVAALDEALRSVGAGRIPGGEGEAAAALAPLRARVAELRRVSRDLEKATLELSYRAGAGAEITMKELRLIAGQLDASAKELSEAVRWFED